MAVIRLQENGWDAILVATVNAIVSIALGVLCGAALWSSLRAAWQRLRAVAERQHGVHGDCEG